MEPYEGFTDNSENEARTPDTPIENVTESAAPAETENINASEPAPEYAPPVDAGQPRREESYVLPEQPRGAYADAGYVPAADAGTIPKNYYCAASEPRTRKEKTHRRGMRPLGVVALCLVCAMLGGLVAGLAPQWMTNRTETAAPAAAITERSAAPADSGSTDTVITLSNGENAKTVTTNKVDTEEMSATDIYYNKAVNQVVGVTTEITYTGYYGYKATAKGYGSGFIISEDGYILTNYHVVEEALASNSDVTVVLHDETEYPATVVGFDTDHDVALLKIEATGLSPAVLGDSDTMLVGEQVYAVGNPTGELEYSMTEGIVSAKDREITAANSSTGRTETISVFQTTAAINGGNSGGPVYNSRGEVIGIVVAKKVSTEYEGLAFAIPINDAVRIAQDLIKDGYVHGKAYMGASIGTVTAAAAQYYGLVQGAIVSSVVEGSAAEKAGLKESDIIVAIDGKDIASRDELVAVKKGYSAGDSAVLKVYREGKYIELTIVFDEEVPAELNAEAPETEAPEQQPETGSPYAERIEGNGSYDDFFRYFFGGSPFGN